MKSASTFELIRFMKITQKIIFSFFVSALMISVVGNMKFDQSANINSLEIAVRGDGENGNFLGVVKGLLNIDEVNRVVKGIKQTSGVETPMLGYAVGMGKTTVT